MSENKKTIWETVSETVKVNLTWKSIVCGFPGCEINDKITCLNYIVSIIVYSIFSVNSRCKFNKISYKAYDIMTYIRSTILLYKEILNCKDSNIANHPSYQLVCKNV